MTRPHLFHTIFLALLSTVPGTFDSCRLHQRLPLSSFHCTSIRRCGCPPSISSSSRGRPLAWHKLQLQLQGSWSTSRAAELKGTKVAVEREWSSSRERKSGHCVCMCVRTCRFARWMMMEGRFDRYKGLELSPSYKHHVQDNNYRFNSHLVSLVESFW